MAFTRYQILLSVLMVATGSINTLSTKWADHLYGVGSNGGKPRKFDHPLVQGCFMFFGEFLCLMVFKILYRYYTKRQVIVEDVNFIRGSQNFNPFIFFPPAMCDMIATTMMYVGLALTYASSFQMLRGSSIVFVALLSSAFVGRQIKWRHWCGIFIILIGLCVVGLSDMSSSSQHDTNDVITGDLLIIIAQIIAACQIVYEEKYIVTKDIPPLQAVGLEGAFGLLVLTFLLFPSYYIKVGAPFAHNPKGVLEDLPDAIAQMSNNYNIIVASLGTMISIAFFNFAGISMTKEVSATTRIVLDSVRTFFIWIFSLIVQWQQFNWLQLVGFTVLFVGMCVYYNILPNITFRRSSLTTAVSQDLIVSQQAADDP